MTRALSFNASLSPAIEGTKHGEEVAFLSRRGTDFTDRFPEIAAELATMPDVDLDAELVMLDENGKPTFERLVRRSRLRKPITIDAKTPPAAIAAFDLLELEGRDVRSLPLFERKTLLEHVLGKSAQKRIFPTTYVGLNGIELFDAADRVELEGIVAKRTDSPYCRGRSRDWLKIKTKHGRAIDDQRAKWNEC
jgi:bifunctional non-homologous end joining protein LigD